MPTKRLLILANSAKKGQHCVAGLQVRDGSDEIKCGKWIRPVSRKGEGELTAIDCQYENGKLPKVWDVVDGPLEEREESDGQPENWFIDPEEYWIKVGDQAQLKMPAVFAETPLDLWIETGVKVDGISPEGLATLGRNQSLYLIAVTDFRIVLKWREWEGRGRHHRRAQFTYNNVHYNLSLTDPDMEKHCVPFPANKRDKTIELKSGGAKILCVSLSPLFRGNHYKIVATVLEIAK